MDCLLIKVTSTKPRVKLPSLQFNTYYPLTELDRELRQLSSQLKKTLVVSLKLVESTKGKQEIEFKQLELDNSFSSLLYWLNEDIFLSEREAEFDEAEQFRQLSQKLASQFEAEKQDIGPYILASEELNQGFLSKLIKKKPPKNDVKATPQEPKQVATDKKESQSTPETKEETPKPVKKESEIILSSTEPVWEEVEQDDVNQPKPVDPVQSTKPNRRFSDNTRSQTSQPVMSQSSTLSFEAFLQIKDDNLLFDDMMEELTRDKSQPIESVAEALGISVTHPTPLEEKQLEFLRKRIDRQLFQRLQLQLSDNINQLDISLNKTLETLYLESGLVEHDLTAFVQQKKEEKEKELGNHKNKEFIQLKEQLADEKKQKLETLTIKHQSELQELKAKQLDETQQLESDFNVYRDDKLERLKLKLSEEVASELAIYQATLQSERQENVSIDLLSKKETLLSKRKEAVMNEVKDLQHEKQAYYESLLNELVDKENEFLLLIQQEEIAQQQAKEQALRERELDIKQEEVNLLSSEQGQKAQQQSEQYELMMSVIQAQLLKATQSEPETHAPKTIEVNVPPSLTGSLTDTNSTGSKWKYFLVSVGVLSALSISFLGMKLSQATQENHSIRTEVTKIEQATQQLNESLMNLSDENTSLKKELTQRKESLTNLLAEENYERAIELYPKELDKIEMAMYEAGDLKQLKAFNQSHASQLGLLDEAILSGNEEKIVEEYHKLTDKGKLPSNRESYIPQESLQEEW